MKQRPIHNVQRWQAPGICLFLAVITLIVFGQTLRHEFINYDDEIYVYNNPVVARGLTLKGFIWAFSDHAYNWHPLTWLSHMLDCQLYGLNPEGHHFTNVLLHTATGIALFLILRQMTGALWRSAFVAAVFAIHPLRVESVAWVAERKDLLSGLFFMLTIGAYVRYARQPWSAARCGMVLLLFALGLMSKPMLVTLPLVLLLLDYWPLQRFGSNKLSKLALEKLPLLAFSAASCMATIQAQNKVIQWTASLSLPLRLSNALTACVIYLGQMVWPTGLAIYYPLPHNGPPAREVVLAGVLLIGLTSAVVWQRRKQPWLLVGWFWYLTMLLPVVGLIQVGRQAHADRYAYLPQIGIYVALTWLIAKWRINRAALGSLMGVVLVVLMVAASKQTAHWQDSETLWTHTLACTTDNDVAHFNFGNALCQKGKMAEGISHYQSAVQIEPDYAAAHVNLGKALMQMGEVDEAISHYQAALKIKPDYTEAHNNLGNALLKKGSLDEAIDHFQQALQAKPDSAEAHSNLGNALLKKGRAVEAASHFQQAAIIAPENPMIQNNLAWLLATSPDAALRNGSKALEAARLSNELTGGTNPIILHSLAAAFAETGQFNDAIRTVQKAIELATTSGRQDLLPQLNNELKRYEAGLPLHQ